LNFDPNFTTKFLKVLGLCLVSSPLDKTSVFDQKKQGFLPKKEPNSHLIAKDAQFATHKIN